MAPMEPLPETVDAASELDQLAPEEDLLESLVRLANHAREVVPDLVGVSIARLEEDLTFTLVASDEDLAVLDAVQYVAGGPCVAGGRTGEVQTFHDDDVLDEERWRLFAEATAAKTVRSTLTLPVRAGARVVGTVNLYAASRRAFAGHHEDLAAVFGAWAAAAITNADLAFSTRDRARETPHRLRERAVIDTAIGILAVDLKVDVGTAEARLRTAAVAAGVGAVELARVIVDIRTGRDGTDR